MAMRSHFLIMGDSSVDWHIIKAQDFDEGIVRWNRVGGDLVA
jgi:hypothetical protein